MHTWTHGVTLTRGYLRQGLTRTDFDAFSGKCALSRLDGLTEGTFLSTHLQPDFVTLGGLGNSTMSSYLVSGVAGFIGSHLADRLLREGHHVIGIDCFTDGYPRWIKQQNTDALRSHPLFTFIEADLLDLDLPALLRGDLPLHGETSEAADRQAAGVNAIFHLAAQAGVRTSWGDGFDIYTRNNILATQRLLEAARDSAVKRFVYASSSSVYGDAETFPTPEEVIPRPVSPYGVTKLAGEHLCLLYEHNYGVPAVVLRFFTVFGPRQRPDMAFHKFILALLTEGEIVVYGDGEQTRDFTYVEDTVDGIVRAALAGPAGQVLNIGGGTSVSVNRVLAVLQEITGQTAQVRRAASQPGDARDTSADIERAAKVLGYQPRWSLEDGLRSQVEWMRRLVVFNPNYVLETAP